MNKIVIIGFISFLFSNNLNAQSENKKSLVSVDKNISVKVKIGNRGNLDDNLRPDIISYLATFEITNNADTAIGLFIATPHWAASWLTDNDSIYLFPSFGEHNTFLPSKLLAKESVTFSGAIRTFPKTKNRTFRIGFADFSHSPLLTPEFEKIKRTQKVYWSNLLKLK